MIFTGKAKGRIEVITSKPLTPVSHVCVCKIFITTNRWNLKRQTNSQHIY